MNILEVLHKTNLFKSKSEIRRLIEQKGLKLDWEVIESIDYDLYAPDWEENNIYINCIGKDMGLPCCQNIKVHTLDSFIKDSNEEGTTYKALSAWIREGLIRHLKVKDHPEDLMKVINNYVLQNYFILSKGKRDFWVLEMY